MICNTYLFVSHVEYIHIVPWVPYKATFKESYIKNGRIKIDELENKHFESVVVVVF